jgi:putative membrane protein
MVQFSWHWHPGHRFLLSSADMHPSRTWLHFIPQHTPIFTYTLIALGISLWIWSAIHPHDIGTWVMEQAATLVGIATVLWLARSVSFDRRSQLVLFALFCIHTIGTHYTYSLTPYEALSTQIFGSTPNEWFNWERNHYDRFVHFSYGLLMAYPIEQTLRQRLNLGKGTSNFLSVNLILSSSALYELVEWCAAITFGGNVGTAYLGTQGDIWDAQADIALAGLGWVVVFCTGLVYDNIRIGTRKHPLRR